VFSLFHVSELKVSEAVGHALCFLPIGSGERNFDVCGAVSRIGIRILDMTAWLVYNLPTG
jgi:hypothetical protein